MTRVLVTGGRDFTDRAFIFETFDYLAGIGSAARHISMTVVHGGCPTGVDRFAREWAVERGFPAESWPADWKRYGKVAVPIRNQAMVDSKPYAVIAFEGGAGTDDCCRKAINAGINVWRIERKPTSDQIHFGKPTIWFAAMDIAMDNVTRDDIENALADIIKKIDAEKPK